MNNSLAATAEHPLQVVANKLKIGKAERRFAEGKWWLIAPLTTIIPDGILNGSKGPGFYPTTETQASVKAWDGMPLTAYHPMDEMGRHTSAGAPGVLDRQGIGIVRDSAWNGKLQHKGWFDEERTKKVNPLIYHNLVHRIPIETSTGLYTDNVEAPKGSNHNGRPYTWTARNYRPDHIAVLPDQVGACSLNDGCGVLVNTAEGKGLVTNQTVTVSQWVENACVCGGECSKCKPSLNSLLLNSKSGVKAIKDEVAKYSPEELEGLRVYANGDLGLAVIDRMDWYDKSEDIDPAANIGKVAERQWGKDRVVYQNEGPSMRGEGWVTLNSLTINPFVSESQRRACYAADDPDWNCDEWSDKTKGKLPEKKPGVENLSGSVGNLHVRPSLLQVLNYSPDEARGEGGKWAYTGAAGERGKTLHKHSQEAHDATSKIAGDKELGGHAGKSLEERGWLDKLLGHYDAQAISEKAIKESSVGNHALASKYHLAAGARLSQAANEVGRASLLHKATRGWLGSGGDKEGEAKLREAASKHLYAGGESGGGEGFGEANKLTEDAHEAAKTAEKHKVAWLHHAAVNAHLKASQAWRDEADKQGDDGLKKVLGSIAAEHQSQAWKHGKAASEAEVDKSSKTAPKGGEKKYEFLKPSTNQLGLRPTLMEVENFNPFHDIKGKFAAAGGAIGAGVGKEIGRIRGALSNPRMVQTGTIMGSIKGRQRGEAVGAAVGAGVHRLAKGIGDIVQSPFLLTGDAVGLAHTGWTRAKPSLSQLGADLKEGFGEAGSTLKGTLSPTAIKKAAGDVLRFHAPLVKGVAVVGKVSLASLVHGPAGTVRAIKDLLGKPETYRPNVAPTFPELAGRKGTGIWGQDYQGAVDDKTGRLLHTFSLSAQNASGAVDPEKVGKKGRKGLEITQEAYRAAQLGNHGIAADKHVEAAHLLQTAANSMKSWKLQAMQAALKADTGKWIKIDGKNTFVRDERKELTPSQATSLSLKDKQVIVLEKAAEANRVASIMQGNSTATRTQRASTLEAIRSSASANSPRNDTPVGHLNASKANEKAAEQWKETAKNEHSPQYKETYSRLIKKHQDLAQQHKHIYFERLEHSKKTKKSTLEKMFEIGKLLDEGEGKSALISEAHENYPHTDSVGKYYVNEHGRRVYSDEGI